jgi:hypothetical protein
MFMGTMRCRTIRVQLAIRSPFMAEHIRTLLTGRTRQLAIHSSDPLPVHPSNPRSLHRLSRLAYLSQLD